MSTCPLKDLLIDWCLFISIHLVGPRVNVSLIPTGKVLSRTPSPSMGLTHDGRGPVSTRVPPKGPTGRNVLLLQKWGARRRLPGDS